MSRAVWLRVTSVVSFVFAIGHTLGARTSWSPLGETDVLNSMRTFRFQTEGVTRSYLDFYRGFGFTLSVFLVLQAVLLWQLGTLAKSDGQALRSIIVTVALASIASGVLTWQYLIPVPFVFWTAITAGLGLALFARK